MTFDVFVVGAGPAGLAAATALSRRGRSTIVVEREAEAGGVPRHCAHTGFGWLDLRRVSSGPQYARRRVGLAREAGVELRTETTVLGWRGNDLAMTSPSGLVTVSSDVRPNSLVSSDGASTRCPLTGCTTVMGIGIPRSVPQSTSRTMTSWETSTSRRVR